MSNPWLKKNPFMSLWLSGANSMLGSARAIATAEVHRQSKAAASALAEELVRVGTKPARKKRATTTRKTKR